MGLENLNEHEQEVLQQLMEKVEGKETALNGAPEEKRKWGKPGPVNPATVQRLLPADKWVDKQISAMEAVGREHYLLGCLNPRKDPIKEGASDEAQKAYETKMKDAKVLKSRQDKLKKRTIDDWTFGVEQLGADKLVDGVVKRRYKVERFVGKWHGLLNTHLATIDALPKATREQREKRMLDNKRGLEDLKGKA